MSKTTYTNPILPGFYPDPSICRVGEDYYMVTSTFEYFPGVPIFHSRDMINWKQIGHCLTRQSQLDLIGSKSSGGIYAPTLRYHEGRFYMVTTDTTGIGNFYVWAEDPAGEWSEPIQVKQGGIDPSLFFEEGKVYFQSNALHWNSKDGLYQSEIDLETGEILSGEPRFLWDGTGGKYPEAPHIFKRDGWYYLLVAEGGTEFTHSVTIARSRDIYGPYEACERNPILSHKGSRSRIQSTGHADFIEDHRGQWWVVFLGVRHSHYPLVHHLGRETYLAPMEWGEDGWPVVNGGELVKLNMEVDREPLASAPEGSATALWRDDFDTETLGLEWNFRRNPLEGSWSLTQHPGALTLSCLSANLDGIDQMSFVGRRHQHLESRTSTAIAFQPESDNEEAGLTIQQNATNHCEIAVTAREGEKVLLVRRRCGTLVVEKVVKDLTGEEPITLVVTSDDEWYHIGYQLDGGETTFVESVETRHLSTEMSGGFTGVYLGLYATANGAGSHNQALFDWFEYEDTTSQPLEEQGAKSQVDKKVSE